MDELKFRLRDEKGIPILEAIPILVWDEEDRYLIVSLGLWSRIRIAIQLALLGRAHLP
jgi:hypothetical protein